MGDILTPWELWMFTADLDEYLNAEDCRCEGVCTCDEEEDGGD